MKKVLVLLIFTSLAQASELPALKAEYILPAVDIASELSKSSAYSGKDQPFQFAVSASTKNLYINDAKSAGGQWNKLNDGSWVWRVKIHSDNALSLGVAFFDFYLPATAELSIFDKNNILAKGPFDNKKNKAHQQLWPGPIIGDTVTVELRVSDEYKNDVRFSIDKVATGFRTIWEQPNILKKPDLNKFWEAEATYEKSGSCNVDVICPEGDEWRDQIRSVARYVVNGQFLCTGQMLNNTTQDGTPLFLTADHCGFNSSNAASINLWWNYDSDECRTPGSAASGTPISTAGFNNTQSGSTYLAGSPTSDFTLLQLDEQPSPTYNVYYSGWDRRDIAPAAAVGIHHPQGDAKRISFENNQTVISSYLDSPPNNLSHIKIPDWDSGTTEGGSSGSGLWSADNKLLVGQLHGGYAACGNNEPDWYGRLYTSWEGDGTASTRLKDWLDPGNTGVETLQGLGSCPEINASIYYPIANGSSLRQSIAFEANVTGGEAPYTYAWDFNGDGVSESSEQSVNVEYSERFSGDVTLGVIDANGCTAFASQFITITGPNLGISEVGSKVEMCGNGDGFIDPGERWKVPVTMFGYGFGKDAKNVYAAMSKFSPSQSFVASDTDTFGNSIGECGFDFIDISSSGQVLPFADLLPNDNYSANDEGIATVLLPQSFNLYGNTINSLYLSSNGYISTDPDDTGADWSQDCPLPALPESNLGFVSSQARLMPLHDDLQVDALYYQHFNNCPRPSELDSNASCDVFMYTGVTPYNAANAQPFDFEAILYPDFSQWVYQYDGDSVSQIAPTVGQQSNSATDALSYTCGGEPLLADQTALCTFHKDFSADYGNDDSYVYLETPALAFGDVNLSEGVQSELIFSIAENAVCGSPVGIKAEAVLHDKGYEQLNDVIVNELIGNNNSCSVVSNCQVSDANDIQPANGLWYNPQRSGNGYDMYYLDTGNDDLPDRLIYVQYTGDNQRYPIWYITGADESMQNNQSRNNLQKIHFAGGFETNNRISEVVGTSTTTLIDANTAVQTRTINGNFSADMLTKFNFGGAATEQRTGLWYNPDQAGWGQSIATQSDAEVLVNYMYDNKGNPFWVLGSGNNQAVENIDMSYFRSFCPHCPRIEPESIPAGPMRINYDNSNLSGTIESLDINVLNSVHESNWQRQNLPIVLLTPPLD